MRKKINWTALGAIVGMMTMCVYAVQAFYMYRTLRVMEGSMALHFFADWHEVKENLIRSNIYPYYKRLGETIVKSPESFDFCSSPEIYAYLDFLDSVSLLFLAERFEEKTLVDFYGDAILFASNVLDNVSERERIFYKEGIIKVGKWLKNRKERKVIIPPILLIQ